jgi:4-hydroxybenzoate polyprenyltransferase
MTGFLRRNPVLKTKKQFRIDSACVNNVTSDILKAWFQKLKILVIKAIKPENRWNIDKTGIIKGQGLNSLVVRSAQKRFIQKKQPGSQA